MSESGAKVFKTLSEKMTWLAHRQKILASNIAHADTPHYRPKDLQTPTFQAFLGTSQSPHITLTHPFHQHGKSASSHLHKVVDRPNFSPKDMGNGIILEEELMKVSETENQYFEMLNVYRRNHELLKAAIGRVG